MLGNDIKSTEYNIAVNYDEISPEMNPFIFFFSIQHQFMLIIIDSKYTVNYYCIIIAEYDNIMSGYTLTRIIPLKLQIVCFYSVYF